MTCNLPVVYSQPNWLPTITANPEHVTEDQQGCNDYLATKSLTGCTVLHVGIGSSSIYKRFASALHSLIGITVVSEEIRIADRDIFRYPGKYLMFLVNKYDLLQLDNYLGRCRFRYIVDNNLKQHACCQQHWEEYFRYLIFNLLEIGGSIITHTQGFQPHTDRITALTVDELRRLAGPGLTVIEAKDMANKHGHYPVEIRCGD